MKLKRTLTTTNKEKTLTQTQRGGEQGSRPPEKTGPDPIKIHKTTKPTFIVGLHHPIMVRL